MRHSGSYPKICNHGGLPAPGRPLTASQGAVPQWFDQPWVSGLDAISVGVILRQPGAMTAALVEPMAPENLWELFQQVVPASFLRRVQPLSAALSRLNQ
jgi:hypothetical protein